MDDLAESATHVKRPALTLEDRKAKIEARIQKERDQLTELQRSLRALELSESKKERKARTRRLIQIGAAFAGLFEITTLDQAEHIVARLREANVPTTLQQRTAESASSLRNAEHAGLRSRKDL